MQLKFRDLRIDTPTTYKHHQSITEMHQVLAGVLHEDMQQKLEKSQFSLMFDESNLNECLFYLCISWYYLFYLFSCFIVEYKYTGIC